MLAKGVGLLQDHAPVYILHVAHTEALRRGYGIFHHPPYFPVVFMSP